MQIVTEGFNLDRSVVVAIYTRHCVRLNCIHIVFEAARVTVCETREETRRIDTYKSHNNLIEQCKTRPQRLLNSSMLGLWLAGKCFRGGGSDLFVASGLSNGPSGGSAAEFMSRGRSRRRTSDWRFYRLSITSE